MQKLMLFEPAAKDSSPSHWGPTGFQPSWVLSQQHAPISEGQLSLCYLLACQFGVSESVQGNWLKSLIEDPSGWLIDWLIDWYLAGTIFISMHWCTTYGEAVAKKKEPKLSNMPPRARLFAGYFWRPGAKHSWDFASLKKFQMWTSIVIE